MRTAGGPFDKTRYIDLGGGMSARQSVKAYFEERQTPAIRFFHIVILLLVVSQILVSNFMEINDKGEIGHKAIEYYGTWAHIITGMVLVPLVLAFVVIELRRYGFGYFFPYLSGDFAQIKGDIGRLQKFELPEPSPKGIAAVVQGLGIGALCLVLISGLVWFFAWLNAAAWANDVKEVHETLTGLVEAYVVGHGAIGILHIYHHVRLAKSH